MNELTKDKTILDLIEKLKLQTEFSKAEIVDHWDGDLCAIGIKKGIRMVYINSLDLADGRIDGYDYDFEILNEDQPDKINVIIESRHVTEEAMIAAIKTFLDI